MGMTDEEREKHIRIANMLIGAINDLERPMLMYQIEKDVAREALENYIKMLEQQPFEDWYDVPSDEMTLEQARQAVKDLRKKLAEYLEQQTSEDCISRDAVKEMLSEEWTKYMPMDLDINLSFVMGKINELPSVTPSYNSIKTELEQTRWIPVSERLPKAFEFVNCTCHSLIDDREDWVIETIYVPQPSNSPYSDWGNIPMLNSGDCKVVAWMNRDIPEPYKAERDNL